MEFFEQANQHVTELNENEKKLFEYVVRNIREVQDMQVRLLAEKCFVSTTTVVRFTKKLGFAGYREFTEALKVTCHMMDSTEVPEVLWKKEYSKEYLQNIVESVRVISGRTIESFRKAVEKSQTICFYGVDMDHEVAHYAYRMFSALGYHVVCPREEYEITASLRQMKDDDVLFIFSLNGKDRKCVDFIEKARLQCKPVVTTLTQSANNVIQSLSDIDFYVFVDHIKYKNADLTARISMFATTELLAYSLISSNK